MSAGARALPCPAFLVSCSLVVHFVPAVLLFVLANWTTHPRHATCINAGQETPPFLYPAPMAADIQTFGHPATLKSSGTGGYNPQGLTVIDPGRCINTFGHKCQVCQATPLSYRCAPVAAGHVSLATWFLCLVLKSHLVSAVLLLQTCQAGKYRNATSHQIEECTPWSNCTDYEWQTNDPDRFIDRICKNLTVCTNTEWESVAPTPTSDRTCKLLLACGCGWYVSKNHTAIANRMCTLCSSNGGGYTQGHNQYSCTPWSSCGVNQYAILRDA